MGLFDQRSETQTSRTTCTKLVIFFAIVLNHIRRFISVGGKNCPFCASTWMIDLFQPTIL